MAARMTGAIAFCVLALHAPKVSAECSDAGVAELSVRVTAAAETAAQEYATGEQVLAAERELLAIVAECRYGYPLVELGRIYERMGRSHDALTIFEELLEDERYALSRAARRYVEEAAALARRSVSYVDVRWNPPDERVLVRIDGERMGERSPDRLRARVNPGEHIVRISGPRRDDAEVRVDVPEGGSEALSIDLPEEDRTGRLVLASEPSVRIQLGERSAMGQLSLRLEEGEYNVILANESARRSQTVEVVAGEVRRYEFDAPDRTRRRRIWLGTVLSLVAAGALTATVFLAFDRDDSVDAPNITAVPF